MSLGERVKEVVPHATPMRVKQTPSVLESSKNTLKGFASQARHPLQQELIEGAGEQRRPVCDGLGVGIPGGFVVGVRPVQRAFVHQGQVRTREREPHGTQPAACWEWCLELEHASPNEVRQGEKQHEPQLACTHFVVAFF